MLSRQKAVFASSSLPQISSKVCICVDHPAEVAASLSETSPGQFGNSAIEAPCGDFVGALLKKHAQMVVGSGENIPAALITGKPHKVSDVEQFLSTGR